MSDGRNNPAGHGNCLATGVVRLQEVALNVSSNHVVIDSQVQIVAFERWTSMAHCMNREIQ
jgi:hypothetical protein